MRKEHLTEKEADEILVSVDKRLFFESLIGQLKYKYLLSKDEIAGIMDRTSLASELAMPVTIFNRPELSALEAICKYLKEEKGMRYAEIANLINRDPRTIWVTYSNACKKVGDQLSCIDSDVKIPLSILQDRKMSVLESIVHYLKDSYRFKYVEIAKLINRDERNVWAIYNKAERKVKA